LVDRPNATRDVPDAFRKHSRNANVGKERRQCGSKARGEFVVGFRAANRIVFLRFAWRGVFHGGIVFNQSSLVFVVSLGITALSVAACGDKDDPSKWEGTGGTGGTAGSGASAGAGEGGEPATSGGSAGTAAAEGGAAGTPAVEAGAGGELSGSAGETAAGAGGA
jgi:hypothetical protein